MNRYLEAPGLKVSLAGAGVFIIGVLLWIFVSSLLGAIVIIAGGLLVFAGLLRTLRTRTDLERRLEHGRH